jgi:hypothetical protein
MSLKKLFLCSVLYDAAGSQLLGFNGGIKDDKL